jgi:hypothetical protein
LPPELIRTSSRPSSAASIISGAVMPVVAGTSKPHSLEKRAAFASSIGSPPGSTVA